jgi:CTP:phosphocholine cytidylyltransferase-like protein
MNCSGCTKYFTKNKESYFFIFFINSKSLIEINGVPFVYHQLELLEKKGLKNIHFCYSAAVRH